MTLSEMQTVVAKRLGDDSAAMKALATDWLNQVQRAMVPMLPWRDLMVNATDTLAASTFVLPAGFVELVGPPAYRDTGLPLFSMTPREMRSIGTLTQARPKWYRVIFDGPTKRHNLLVKAEPDVPYPIEYDYITGAVDMAGAGDTPVFPHVYHELMVSGAIEIGKSFDQKTDRPLEWQKFQQWLGDAIAQARSSVGRS